MNLLDFIGWDLPPGSSKVEDGQQNNEDANDAQPLLATFPQLAASEGNTHKSHRENYQYV